MLPLSLTACPERLLSELIKESFEVPAHKEERGELSAEGSHSTDSVFDSMQGYEVIDLVINNRN